LSERCDLSFITCNVCESCRSEIDSDIGDRTDVASSFWEPCGMSRAVAALFSARHGREPKCDMRGTGSETRCKTARFPCLSQPLQSCTYLELIVFATDPLHGPMTGYFARPRLGGHHQPTAKLGRVVDLCCPPLFRSFLGWDTLEFSVSDPSILWCKHK
jgi:hypothetical protein